MATSRRRSAPKGRGGCSTCKFRHVRCDKQLPRCTPCQTSSRQCEYSTHLVKSDPDPLKVVLWQPNLSLQRICPDPSQTNREIRAVDFFRNNVAVSLGGCFDSNFWTHDVLRVAQNEPSVRYALVALASLAENMQEANSQLVCPPNAFALQQHTRSISELKRKMQSNREGSEEVVLMSCVLFICFEIFQNHHESALHHMSSGIFVFYDWHSKLRRECETSSVPGNYTEFAIQLERVFERLMLQTVCFVDTRPSEWHFLKPEFAPTMPSMPHTFRNIGGARDRLNSCLCSLYHGALATSLLDLEHEAHLPDEAQPPGPAQTHDPLHDWVVAFESLIADQELSSRDQHAAALLEIQLVTGSILVASGAYNKETLFDSFETSFSQIVDLASGLVTDECRDKLPAFDMGILPSLYFVASRCRYPSIRRQALDLLRRGPKQESIWHSGMLSNIAERIMTIEEADSEGATSSVDIPAAARVTVLNATIHSGQRKIALHCCRQESDDRTPQVLHESVEY